MHTKKFVKLSVILFCKKISKTKLCLKELNFPNFSVTHVSNKSDLRSALEKNPVSVIIADLILHQGRFVYQDLFLQIKSSPQNEIQLIFVANNGDFSNRLAAIRSGGDIFLEAPIKQNQILEILEPLVESYCRNPYRILIVDSSKKYGKIFKKVFLYPGMDFKTVGNIQNIIDQLNSFSPELVILGENTSDYSRYEILLMIEQNRMLLGVPILSLFNGNFNAQERTTPGLIPESFSVKDLYINELVSTIRARASQFRSITGQAIRDGLTGLLNPTMTKKLLEAEAKRAQRLNLDLTFVMIDIDRFKKINDTFGHTLGDQVIKELANLLKNRLRKSDVIGRMGGDEFGIILCATNASQAFKLIEDLKSMFSKILFKKDNQKFKCSFSAGISEHSGAADASTILEMSDKALLKAKSSGRDKIHREEMTKV